METQMRWYALYTKPRWEKKVDGKLKENGIHSYCPLSKVKKKWSDRYKVVSEPLFKSYVFVQIPEQSISAVRQVNGVVNFVYWNGKRAIIRDDEMDQIRKFLNDFNEVAVEPIRVQPKDRVVISRGLMMGKEAVVERVLNNSVELVIESLGYKLVAKTDIANVVTIEKQQNG